MIKTAKIISAKTDSDEAGLFDWVELYFEEVMKRKKYGLSRLSGRILFNG
jgi:hypothetical protein